MQTHTELTADIDGHRPAEGEGALWWLGQHSFVLKLGADVVYIDPFLSARADRTVAPLLRPADLAHAALVCGTHDHGDHIDRACLPAIAAATDCPLVVPRLLLPELAHDLDLPQDRFVGLNDGDRRRFGGLTVTAVAAAHEFVERDPATGLCPYLGYVIEGGGCKVYHAGDTCLYEGLHARLRELAADVMLLPINGRDAARLARGCIGNMTYQEAADLAGAVRPGLTVPAHFDMFAGNTEDPALFEAYMQVKYPGLRVHIPSHGGRIAIRPAAG